ncbi:MAG: hypothetical protein O2968_16860 [Acidobacteria bacterium]|nr:hypothetical protein [Acidobacteriota bacterium]
MKIVLSPEQEASLEASAKQRNTSKEALAAEAVTAFLDHDVWFREEVEKGRASARQGRLIEHAEVVRRLYEHNLSSSS